LMAAAVLYDVIAVDRSPKLGTGSAQ
jgi:hypothetical protein